MVDPPQSFLAGSLQLALLGSDDPLVLDGQVGRVGGDKVDLVEQDVADYFCEGEGRTVYGDELFEEL